MNCPIPNQNQTDRTIRLGVGLIGLLLGNFVLTGIVQQVALVLGGLALFTGIAGFCGLYQLIGISTNRKKS